MVESERTCTIEGCNNPHRRNGLCGKHSQRARRLGSATAPVIPYRDLDALIELHTNPDSHIPCHEWTGNRSSNGYGRLPDPAGVRGTRYAHVVIWERENGPVPKEMTLDHECHNDAYARGECAGGPTCHHRRCVNLDHLVLRPPKENVLRGGAPSAVNARKTECKDGHEFTEENTYINPNGQRICRTCRRAYKRWWRANGGAT